MPEYGETALTAREGINGSPEILLYQERDPATRREPQIVKVFDGCPRVDVFLRTVFQ